MLLAGIHQLLQTITYSIPCVSPWHEFFDAKQKAAFQRPFVRSITALNQISNSKGRLACFQRRHTTMMRAAMCSILCMAR